MATFAGTSQKCKACEKTVYLVDQLQTDGKVYHRACFSCHHCKGTLKLTSYNSYEGVLYCKPHFDQLLKQTGSLDKSFEGAPRTSRIDRSAGQGTNSKVSSLFAGTQDKCVACKKTVYPIEKVAVDGSSYHRQCFKCSHGGCVIVHKITLNCDFTAGTIIPNYLSIRATSVSWRTRAQQPESCSCSIYVAYTNLFFARWILDEYNKSFFCCLS